MSAVRRSMVRWGVLATAGGLLLLAGCTAGGSDSGGGDTASVGQAVAPNPAAKPDESARDSSGAPDAGSAATGVPDLPRALIRTADITVKVDDVGAAARTAQDYARAAGGGVAGDNRAGTGRDARADLILKVPPAQLDGSLDRLGGLGEEVGRASSTQDVTEDVADVDVRVRSMQASIARVRAILSQATRIGDVVAVEGELSRRTTELESLQARQRALAGQTSLATVTLHLLAKGSPATPPAERTGFLGGLRNGWDAFTTAVGWVLTGIGAVLPFLIVLVPLALAALWYARRVRRTPPAGPVEPARAPAATP
ncbi:MAG TPA: DUF4349 domain-containing protein [Mycobacteriales bacterium]